METSLHALLGLFSYTAPWDSPYAVPVSGCIMILGIVLGGIWAGVRSQEMRSQERLAAIARGMAPPTDPEAELLLAKAKIPSDPRRTYENLRRGGIVLVACGLGLVVFFVGLAVIFGSQGLVAAAMSGVLPLFIGAGLLIDAHFKYQALIADGVIDPVTGAVTRGAPFHGDGRF